MKYHNKNIKNYSHKQKKKISVFTVIEGFKLSKNTKKRVQIFPYEALSESHREWILENAIRMIEHPTEAEIAFEQTLVHCKIDYEKQAFFRINERNYFLDFYLPKSRIAIEIDGSIHHAQKEYDKFRDGEFVSIGIKTIRIHNSQAYKTDIISIIESKNRVKLR